MITNYFIKKSVRKLAEESLRDPHHSVPYEQVRSVLLLYDAADHSTLQQRLDVLRAERKQLHTCVFVGKGETVEGLSPSALVVEETALSRWGFPSEELVNQVSALPADLLIDLTRPSCYPMQYLALRHPSTFKVGIKYPGQDWYDLGLARIAETDIAILFDQMLYYLRTIHA